MPRTSAACLHIVGGDEEDAAGGLGNEVGPQAPRAGPALVPHHHVAPDNIPGPDSALHCPLFLETRILCACYLGCSVARFSPARGLPSSRLIERDARPVSAHNASGGTGPPTMPRSRYPAASVLPAAGALHPTEAIASRRLQRRIGTAVPQRRIGTRQPSGVSLKWS